MKTASLLKTTLLILFAAASTASATSGELIIWPVNIVPAGSSEIEWSTTSPPQSGILTKSGKLCFNKGSDINFRFIANSGYNLIHVYKNAEDEIAWVNSHGGKDSFGPVQKAHTIIAICEALNPTGNFTGNSTDAKVLAGKLTAMADVTGNYNGTATVKTTPRTYNADVAMDDSGKLSTMGTVSGIANKDGGPELSGAGGSVTTVANQPYAALKVSFKGSKDGKPVTGSGAASGELVFLPGTQQLDGVASGTTVVDGNKTVIKPTTVGLNVPPADVAKLKKSWGLTLSIAEVPATAKIKKYVTAAGVLRLTSGESSKFLPRKVTYSAKTGYLVSFASGQKLDVNGAPVYVKIPKSNPPVNKLDAKGNPIPVLDKKSTLKITRMLLNQSGSVWTPTSGSMEYKFLGQKGKGALTSFLD